MKEIAIKAVKEAGKLLLGYYKSKNIITKRKTARDIQLEADIKAEELIIRIIKEQFPDHNIFAEESGNANIKSPYTWLIDPLDGTVNFSASIPFWCVSIALKKGADIILGVIYAPLYNELFVAERGKGATLNGKPMHVTTESSLKDAILSMSDAGGKDIKIAPLAKAFLPLLREGRSLRMLGSTALSLAYVAQGRLSCYFSPYSSLYGNTAGILLVQEAGGRVTDFRGNQLDFSKTKIDVLASNEKLHDPLLNKISHSG